MKTKSMLILILAFAVLTQAGCTASADACPSPTSSTRLLTNAEEGYCLLHPAEYSTDIPHYIVINPIHAPGDKPGDAWISIETEEAAGRTASQAAETEIAAAGPGFNITRSDIKIDNAPAVMVDGLPGPDPLRRVFVVHHDRLYILTFMPWQPNAQGAGQTTPLEDLYALIIRTFHFMATTK